MKVVIVGAGEVGFNIASHLVSEGQDVVLVERDEAVLAHATAGLDIQGMRGHGARPDILEQAGVAEASMLVAVTDSDEVNMVACLNAAILGPRDIIKIARVRAESYTDPRIFGDPRVSIDLAINPERVAADKILALLQLPKVTDVVEFADGRVRVMALRVHPTSPLAGMRLIDLRERLDPAVHLLIAAIHRDTEVIIPHGFDVILPGDEVYIVTAAENTKRALAQIGVTSAPIHRVMIIGASQTGRFLAADLSARGLKPKIIEQDPKLARWLAEALPHAVVVCGNPTDADLLQEENAGEMEAFIACSRHEEANVMSSLVAKQLGARRIIATTNRADYLPVMKAIGIDVCISPRIDAVSSILHFIRKGRVAAVRALGEDNAAEAIEFEAQLTSDVVGTPLHGLRWPKRALIAAIIRDEQVLIPSGDTLIEAGDHVVVVAHRSAIDEVERMLSRRVDRVR